MEENKKPVKLAFMIPAYNGTLDLGHANMWLQIGSALTMEASEENPDFQLLVLGGGSMNPVGKIRNAFVESAIEAGSDWLVMIDADTFTDEVSGIFDMIREGIAQGIPVMTGVVMSRSDGEHYTVFARDGGTDTFHALDRGTLHGNLVEVDRCGAALLAIDLGWIQEHWPEGPWFVHAPPGMGEDWYFCAGVQERGGRIVADGRMSTAHVRGRQLVTWDA